MVHTVVDGAFRQTNLSNESSEYLVKREELRRAEIELMRQRERVAELRRTLPEGAPVAPHRINRRLEQQLPHHGRGLLQITRELRVDLGIVTREARELRLGLIDVITEEDVIVATERAEQIVGRQYFQTQRVQFQLPDDPWV